MFGPDPVGFRLTPLVSVYAVINIYMIILGLPIRIIRVDGGPNYPNCGHLCAPN